MRNRLGRFGQLALKRILAPLLYRHRPIGLSSGKLYLYLEALYSTRSVPGAVVEIGCHLCGTAALGHQMLRKLGSARDYVCVDTFGGFVESQFDREQELGGPVEKRDAFAANDIRLARKILRLHGADSVKLIQANISSLAVERLPEPISVCLIDVDLYEPTRDALEKVYGRMSQGGVILVDDCGGATEKWRSDRAFHEFVAREWSEHRVEFGMGIIRLAPALPGHDHR
jgi:hypothetical protein